MNNLVLYGLLSTCHPYQYIGAPGGWDLDYLYIQGSSCFALKADDSKIRVGRDDVLPLILICRELVDTPGRPTLYRQQTAIVISKLSSFL